MDTFDLRKYFTEAKLAEQKKAYIEYDDGTTDKRTFHQSVSDAKIRKMLAAGTEIDGKKIVKVIVGDSLDQATNE